MSSSVSTANPAVSVGVSTNTAIAAATDKTTLLTNMQTVALTDAKAIPSLVGDLTALDPSLVPQVQAKSLIWAKSPFGTMVGFVVSWAVTKYALGWDANTVTLVTGLVTGAVAYALRYVTNQPIQGILSTTKTSA